MRLFLRFSPVLLATPFLCFALACGLGKSLENEPPEPDAGTPDARQPDSGRCSTDVPTIGCGTDCDGSPLYPSCENGVWLCPVSGACPIEPDAGPDACAPAIDVNCPVYPSCASYNEATCENGQWTCEFSGDCFDTAPPDFACGDFPCNPSSSYCQITTGGPVPDDGGNATQFTCLPIPAFTCDAKATCACVQAGAELSADSCDCVAQGSDVIITCVAP